MHDTMKKPRHKTPSPAKRARSASGADEGERSDKGRWSSRRKTEIVLRDRGALNRSRPYERLTRSAGPRGVSDEASDEQEAAPSRGGGGEAQAG
jgi:hypothetical protein